MGLEIKHESIFKKGALKGDFGVKVDKANNRVYLYFNGYFDTSCAEKFFGDYMAARASVDMSKTSLFVVAKELKPFPQEALDSAGEIYKGYLDFKDVTLVEPDNVTAKMQIHRVLRNNNIESKYKFVTEL